MSRIQLALNVDNLDEAITFYTRLFDVEPAKVKPGYANFVVADPPLKLVLLETAGQGGTLNHLGVEVPTSDACSPKTAGSRRRVCSPTKRSTRPVATPPRTRCG